MPTITHPEILIVGGFAIVGVIIIWFRFWREVWRDGNGQRIAIVLGVLFACAAFNGAVFYAEPSFVWGFMVFFFAGVPILALAGGRK